MAMMMMMMMAMIQTTNAIRQLASGTTQHTPPISRVLSVCVWWCVATTFNRRMMGTWCVFTQMFMAPP